MKRSGTFTVGLVICAILGVVDVVSLAGLGVDDGPPVAVAIIGAVLGVITLAAIRPARAGQSRGSITVIASRIASAVLGIPVFFVDSAPDWARVAVAILIAFTAVGIGLMTVAASRPTAAA